MPEGPSLVILKEEVQPFKKKKILKVGGWVKIDRSLLKNKTVTDFKTWGKQFLICFPNYAIRIHFMLFGTWGINKKVRKNPALHLTFPNGDLFLYTNSLELIKGDPNKLFDWSADVMGNTWDPRKARQKLQNLPDSLVCDVLLDQNIFAGSGNIIKNEVLFRTRVHPESTVSALPAKKLTGLIKEVRNYSFDFLEWKKADALSQHWQAHKQKTCPRCNIPFKIRDTGKLRRKSFYCENCQELYK